MIIATKEQERNTLEKIKQMVSELGENSYLATAFTGAFALAEGNIEDDAAFSTQYYIDQTRKTADVEKREKKAQDELARTREMLKAVQEAHGTAVQNFEATQERARKYASEIDELKAEVHYEESIIMELKAKLYDYMTRTA